ncbi:Alginate lyase [Granulicella rosea]|uniref:Alginate lyase n=1 Tax=Granulicella rosea TaxID=474952 RepID=A0A239MJN0_9BACT|nr:alginate lyase family protein [Granulicella rosea]SNT42344.1 Alginate lyase [Granulicella rosea]
MLAKKHLIVALQRLLGCMFSALFALTFVGCAKTTSISSGAYATIPTSSDAAPVFVTDARIVALSQAIAAGSTSVLPYWTGSKGGLLTSCTSNLNAASNAPADFYFPDTAYNTSTTASTFQAEMTTDGSIAFGEALCYRIQSLVNPADPNLQAYANTALSLIEAWQGIGYDICNVSPTCPNAAGTGTVAMGSFVGNTAPTVVLNYQFPQFIYAAALLRRSSVWTSSEETAYETFLKGTILPVAQLIGPGTQGSTNNLNNSYINTAAAIYAFLGDQTDLQTLATLWAGNIASQIADEPALDNPPTSTTLVMIQEYCRNLAGGGTAPADDPTEPYCSNDANSSGLYANSEGANGIFYSTISLNALAAAAEVFQNNGIASWSLPAAQEMSAAFVTTTGWITKYSTFPYAAALTKALPSTTISLGDTPGWPLLQARLAPSATATYVASLSNFQGQISYCALLYSVSA